MNTVYITDITGVIGEWLDMEFDDEIPNEVIDLLQETYNAAIKKLQSN